MIDLAPQAYGGGIFLGNAIHGRVIGNTIAGPKNIGEPVGIDLADSARAITLEANRFDMPVGGTAVRLHAKEQPLLSNLHVIGNSFGPSGNSIKVFINDQSRSELTSEGNELGPNVGSSP